MILKVMILPSANMEEQILYLLPIVITDPSCTIWSWKSFGSNYMLLGLKVREGGGACNWLISKTGKMCSHFFHPHSFFVTRRPHQHALSTLQDLYIWLFFLLAGAETGEELSMQEKKMTGFYSSRANYTTSWQAQRLRPTPGHNTLIYLNPYTADTYIPA